MIYFVLSRSSCIFLCLFFICYMHFSYPNDDAVDALANNISIHYAILKKIGGLKEGSPFLVGLSGSSGIGKTTMALLLKNKLQCIAANSEGDLIKAGVLSQDIFTFDRQVRIKTFGDKYGVEGVSGVYTGEELRFSDLEECLSRIQENKPYTGVLYHPIEKKCYNCGLVDLTDKNIVVFEGGHSMSENIFPFVHFGVHLTGEKEIIRYQRAKRSLREKRSDSIIMAIINVSENQYPKAIKPNQIRTVFAIRNDYTDSVPSVEDYLKAPKDYSGTPEFSIAPIDSDIVVHLSPSQKEWVDEIQRKGIVDFDDKERLKRLAFFTPAALQEYLTKLLGNKNRVLCYDMKEHSLFHALKEVCPEFWCLNKDSVTNHLVCLQDEIKEKKLCSSQKELLGQYVIDLFQSSNIETLLSPRQLGVEILVLFWASLLPKEPKSPLYFICLSSNQGYCFELTSSGECNAIDVSDVPSSASILVCSGGNNWMWIPPVITFCNML